MDGWQCKIKNVVIWACARGHLREFARKLQPKDIILAQLSLLLLQVGIIQIVSFGRNFVFAIKRLWNFPKICMLVVTPLMRKMQQLTSLEHNSSAQEIIAHGMYDQKFQKFLNQFRNVSKYSEGIQKPTMITASEQLATTLRQYKYIIGTIKVISWLRFVTNKI